MASKDGLGNLTPTAGIVSLTELKTHLRYPTAQLASSPDDINLMGFIYAATEVIEAEVGNIVQRQVVEYHDGGTVALYLREKPVVRVIEILENWGYYNWDLVEQQPTTVPATSLFAYSIENPEEGRVTRRSVGNIAVPFMSMGGLFPNNIRVTYITGREGTPWSVRLACLELCALWWRTFEQRQSASGGSPARPIDQSTSQIAALVGVPNRVMELLKSNRRGPIIA
jgi:hypothetical protein